MDLALIIIGILGLCDIVGKGVVSTFAIIAGTLWLLKSISDGYKKAEKERLKDFEEKLK